MAPSIQVFIHITEYFGIVQELNNINMQLHSILMLEDCTVSEDMEVIKKTG